MLNFEYQKDFTRVDENKMEKEIYDLIRQGEYAEMQKKSIDKVEVT